MLKFYQIIIGWESYYSLDKQEAINMYNNSGESDKELIEFTVRLTPELFVYIINEYCGINLTEIDHKDIVDKKYSWNLGL